MNELMLEICKLAFQKNHENKNTIFLRFYGHVNCFDVSVFKNGWDEENSVPDYEKNVYMAVNSENDNKKELKEIIEYLKSLEE